MPLFRTLIAFLCMVTALVAAQPGVTIAVTQNGVPVAEGGTVSGTIVVTVTATDAIALHVQLYSNFAVSVFNEPGHAPDTPVWSHTGTIDTTKWFDGENLLSVHVHPHNHAGEPYTTNFTVGTFKVVSENGRPAPNGDRLLPTLQFGTGWTPVGTMQEFGHLLSGAASIVDDSGTFGVDRSSNTASPVQMIAHLGESVLGRFRWDTLNPPFGDSDLVHSCSLRPFQTTTEFDARVVVFFADGAGRANYGFKTFRMPVLTSQATASLPNPWIDAKVVGLSQGAILRVPTGGTTPVWVELKNLRSGTPPFTGMTTWIGNRAVKVTALAPILASLPLEADSAIVEVSIPSTEIVKFLNARQGGAAPTAAPIWVDFNRGTSPCMPTSGHVHLSSIRTTSYPWEDPTPTVSIRAPWNGSNHWTGSTLNARYDHWGSLPSGYRVQWSLDSGAWNDDNADGIVALTGLTRSTHQFAMRLVTSADVQLGNTATVSFTVINSAPQTQSDGYQIVPDTQLTVAAPGVIGNDSDSDGDTLVASQLTAPFHGTAMMAADGSFVYQPPSGWTGFDRFTYQVNDGNGGTRRGEVRILVKATASGANLPGDWSMHGRDAGHSGHFPGIVGDMPPTLAWTYNFTSYNVNRLEGVAASNGRVVATIGHYVQGPIQIVGIDGATGVLAWDRQLNAGDITEPTVAYDKVFVQRANIGNDCQVMALSLADGSTTWSQPYADQSVCAWGGFIVADGGAWIEGGYYGGLLGYDANSGAVRFSKAYNDWHEWAPAWNNGKVYNWIQGQIREHDPTTGVVERSVVLDGTQTGTGSMYMAPVIAGGDILVRSTDGVQLYAVGLSDLQLRWRAVPATTSLKWQNMPAVADGVVYAPDSTGVVLLDQSTGAALGRITMPSWPVWGPIITDDAIVVGHAVGSGATLIYDRITLGLRMTIPFAGPLALSDNRLYIADFQTTSLRVRCYSFSASPAMSTLALSAATYSMAEGQNGTTLATITVTRNATAAGAVSVNYATANGSATAGSDYAPVSGTLSWTDGDSAAKTFTIAITSDTMMESDETVLLSLSSPTGNAVLGLSAATLTITNDDVVTWTTVTLQNELNGYTGTIDSYLSNGSPTNTAGGATQNLTATHSASGDDSRVVLVKFPIFSTQGGPVPAGATITTATLSLYQYSAVAHNFGAHRLLKTWSESGASWNNAQAGVPWTVAGANGSGSDIAATPDGTASTTASAGWLNIDVTTGVQSFAGGATNHGWRLKGIGGPGSSENFRSREYVIDFAQRPKLTITYATGSLNLAPTITQAASATPNPIVSGSSTTLNVAANDADGDTLSYTWSFGDSTTGTGATTSHTYNTAGAYTASVTVTDGRGGSTSSNVVVTVNNPPIGTLTFTGTAFSQTEGNSGTTVATVSVARSGGSFGAVSVNYATANGTAIASADYNATSGTLSWASGDVTTKTFTVAVIGDTAVESDETIFLNLTSPSGGATLGTSNATLSVVNDDTAVAGTLALSAATYSQNEGNSGTASATITVTRSGGSDGAVSVTYATSNGTATAGSDYTAASGALSWNDGDATTKTFTISVTGDTTTEGDETVLLALSSPSGGASLGLSAATLIIVNDDAASATSVTLQNGLNGYVGTIDAYMSSSSPTNTAGGATQNLTATHNALGDDTRVVLVRFAIFAAEGGPVPDGATITSATLSLNQYTAIAHNFGAHRVLKAWNETTNSWNNAQSGVPWTTAGANGIGSDIVGTADGTGATIAAVGWLNINVTAGVQAFADGTANYGWRLKGIGGTTSSENFRSREHASDATVRPKLVIEYVVPSAPSGSG